MPSPLDPVSRRRILLGGGLLTLLALATPGCGRGQVPPVVDELESLQRGARSDSELAAAAAAALPAADRPLLGPALAQVAVERAEHAQALAAEIARTTGKPEPEPAETKTEPTPETQTGTPAGSTGPAAPPPTVYDVIGALRTAADGAGKLATTSSGYRAGLLASIAASCTAAYTVALVAQS